MKAIYGEMIVQNGGKVEPASAEEKLMSKI